MMELLISMIWLLFLTIGFRADVFGMYLMSSKSSINGVVVPVVTPVDNNDCVDEKAFRDILRHCLGNGVNGIFVGGSAGAGPLLVEKEWKRAMGIARDEVDSRYALMGGVICPSTALASERIRFLEHLGYEHFVVTPTFYLRQEDDQQFLDHFDGCRQQTYMDMIIYNIPGCTNSVIPVSVITEMAQKGWFKVVKESSGDREYFRALLDLADKYNLNVLQGNEQNIAWSLQLGASGMVPVCANYEPQTYVKMWQVRSSGSMSEMEQLQLRANQLCDNILEKPGYWISGMLYALSTLGYGSARPVAPFRPLTDEGRRHIDMFLKGALDMLPKTTSELI